MIPKFILGDRQRIRLGVAVRIRSHLHTIDRYPAAGRLICMVRRCYRHSGVLMTERRNEIFLSPPLEKDTVGKHPRSIREHRVAPASFPFLLFAFFSFSFLFFFFNRSVYSIDQLADPRLIQGMTSRASVSSILKANHMAKRR